MGTGIVFVVLVAIWVAYFVQYWSRRREHLATARSVEAFSEAMRVLERRPVLRAPSGDRMSTAYAVSPARVVGARPAPRPQVIAKPHAPTKPSPSRGGVPRMSSPQPSRPTRPESPEPTRASTPQRRPGARPRPHGRQAPVTPSRRVRGLTLLGSLATTIVLAVLAGLSILLPWVPLVGVAAVIGSFLWVRAGVRSERSARRAGRGGRRPARAASRPRRPVPATGELPGRSESGRSATAGLSDGDGLADAVGDAELVERTEVTTQTQERPDGWRPVPVPPPTYTLKAKAGRPAPASGDPVPSASVPNDSAAGYPAVGGMTVSATTGSDPTPAPTPEADVAGAAGSAGAESVVASDTAGLTVPPAEGEQQEQRTAAYGT